MGRVLIAGGGPVGLTTSLVLARFGVPSLVIEPRHEPTPRDESRAITWMPRALELLDWLGLGEHFDAVGLRRTGHEFWIGGRPVLRIPFDQVDSPHHYTLQLPQGDTERLLEEAALETGLVEIRRGHEVVGGDSAGERGRARVRADGAEYELTADWAVGADGARTPVRHFLGIPATWRDYGAQTVVADFDMETDLDPLTSRIVLDHRRPYGFFLFAPGRWRFVYRINAGEDPRDAATETTARALLAERLATARVGRFLWGSSFALRQGQATSYRSGRWILAGDAAHAMGPSAGAGMMIGVLGAWRLAWRLAAVARGGDAAILDDYEREHRAAADQIQRANALIFRNIALANPFAARSRGVFLHVASRTPMPRRMAATDSLVAQELPVHASRDRPSVAGWRSVGRAGSVRVGLRLPGPFDVGRPESAQPSGTDSTGYRLVPLGARAADAEEALAEALRSRLPLPITVAEPSAPGRGSPAYALVRPDGHVAALYRAARAADVALRRPAAAEDR